MVELESSSGVLNTVKKQPKIANEPDQVKSLRIIGSEDQINDCLSLIAESKPDSLWFDAEELADVYTTEDGSYVFELQLDSMLKITFGEIKNLSRLFCDLIFVADKQDLLGGLPNNAW